MENRLVLAIAAATLFSMLVVSIPPAFAATVSWDFPLHSPFDGGFDTFTTVPSFTVTDASLASNGIPNQKIQVLVNSTSDPSGITLTLTESGDTGVFTGQVVFSNGTGTFDVSSSQTIGVNHPFDNTDPNAVNTIISGPQSFDGIVVFSSSNPPQFDSFNNLIGGGIFMNLTETGNNTGIFTHNLHFSTSSSVNGSSIKVSGGDIVTIQDWFNLDVTNEIVTPNPNPALGAVPSKFGDTVDVVYNGIIGSTSLTGGSAPGGGGGGLIRPGTVLEAVLGGGKNSGVYDAPSIGNDYYYRFGGGITINGKPFDIQNYSTTIPQQVLKIGASSKFGFKIFDERGANTISDVVMYFHFKGDPSPQNADTWLSWDRARGAIMHDPEDIFSKTSVKTEVNGSFLYANFTMVPQKPMPDSSLIMRMWDDKLAMGDVPIWGAIVIVDPNAPVQIKKVPTDQYGDYATLERILAQDGYEIPTMLNKLHSMPEVYPSVDINWVYDKGVDKLTMVESDKSDNLLGTLECDLTKKASQPAVTDHNYFIFTTRQLNRLDVSQEEDAKRVEAQKAVLLAQDLGLVRQSNFG